MIGTVLNERYRLDAELGRGGMGVVYRAHDTLLKRDVAVKMMSATALGTEGHARLLHEARAAASLNHPNVVTVHDVAETDDEFLHRAYERVMLVASQTQDETLRKSWLENVRENREIIAEWKARGEKS